MDNGDVNKDFTVKISFDKEGEDFQEILEKIIFNRIKKYGGIIT